MSEHTSTPAKTKNKELILVTGGAGFLGINLVRFLLAKGYDVRVIDLLEFTYPEADKVDHIVGDVRDREQLEEVMKGVDFVVHCAMALPLYPAEDIYTTGINGTRNVVQLANKLKIKRVVHISSSAVYGIPDHHPLIEGDVLDGVGPYGKAKVQAEFECLQERAKGLCVPIIRPKSFVGPERLGVFALFYDWAADKHGFPMIGNGHNRYQLLDVEDLCDAIWRCMWVDEAKANDTFNIGAAEFTTMREDYQAVLDEAGFGKKVKGTPAFVVIGTLRLLERMKLSPLYKWVYETASKDSFVSIEKATEQLDWKPKYSNKDAMVRNYRWFIENRSKLTGEDGVTHRLPWKQGAIGLAKMFF